MAEMYENDPTSVPEVSRSRLRCILPSSSSSLYLLGRYGNSYSLYFSLTTPLCCQICQIYYNPDYHRVGDFSLKAMEGPRVVVRMRMN
jgi:hypothetical protein